MASRALSLDGRRVWVAGHRGMVGAALMRRMAGEGAVLLTVPHAQLDLRRQSETEDWIARNRPEFILIAAAKVGGILANDTYPAQFLYDNLMIQSNIVEAARSTASKCATCRARKETPITICGDWCGSGSTSPPASRSPRYDLPSMPACSWRCSA